MMKRVLLAWALCAVAALVSSCTITGDVVHGNKTAFEKNAKSFSVAGSNNTNAHLDEKGAIVGEGELLAGNPAKPHLVINNAGASSGNQEVLSETLTETTASTGADNRAASREGNSSGEGAKKTLEISPDVKVSPTGL